MAADFPDGCAGCQHMENFLFVFYEDAGFGRGAFWAAEDLAFGTAEGEGLFGTERNQVAFNFSDEAECEAEDLAVDGVVEAVPLLGRMDVDSFLQTFAHYGHDVGETSA